LKKTTEPGRAKAGGETGIRRLAMFREKSMRISGIESFQYPICEKSDSSRKTSVGTEDSGSIVEVSDTRVQEDREEAAQYGIPNKQEVGTASTPGRVSSNTATGEETRSERMFDRIPDKGGTSQSGLGVGLRKRPYGNGNNPYF